MITVVTGPPCAGKSTHVRENRDPGDLVVDIDALAYALGYPTDQIDWTLEHVARDVARSVRIDLVDRVLAGGWWSDLGVDAWIVDTSPGPVARRFYRDAGVEWVRLDPGIDVCLERAAARSPSTVDQILTWYEQQEDRPTSSAHRRSL